MKIKPVEVDRTLPMIRPVAKISNVTNISLLQAQDTAAFFFDVLNTSETGQNLYAPGVLLDMAATVKAEQINVQNIAADSTSKEADVMNAFAINELLLQVLTDYEALASGKKRRFEEKFDIAEMLGDVDNQDSKNGDDSVNVDSKEDKNDKNEALPLALDPPPTEASSTKRDLTKKKSRDLKGVEKGPIVPENDKKASPADDSDLLSFLNQSAPKTTKPPAQSLDPLFFLSDSPAQPNANNNANPNSSKTKPTPSAGTSTNNSKVAQSTVNTDLSELFSFDSTTTTTTTTNNTNQKKVASAGTANNGGGMGDPFFDGSTINPPASKPKPFVSKKPDSKPQGNQQAINPFDTLEDPFSSMGSIKPTDPSVNPFSKMGTKKRHH